QVGAAVTVDEGLPDQWMLLESVLHQRGRDVLAAGGDDEFLLSVGDPQVIVPVQAADVTGGEPPVLVGGGKSLSVRLPVSGNHRLTSDAHLRFLGDAYLYGLDGAAHRAAAEP